MKNQGQTTEDNRDSGLLSNPLSFIHSGGFYWYNAGLRYRGGLGNYWFLRSHSTTYSYNLYFGSTYLGPQYYDYHGYGFAVRCALHFLFLNS